MLAVYIESGRIVFASYDEA
jgi:hypothetical protein